MKNMYIIIKYIVIIIIFWLPNISVFLYRHDIPFCKTFLYVCLTVSLYSAMMMIVAPNSLVRQEVAQGAGFRRRSRTLIAGQRREMGR